MEYQTPNKKTKRPLDNDDDEQRPSKSVDYWPHFLILQTLDDTPLKLNPFAISKGIHGIAGEIKDVVENSKQPTCFPPKCLLECQLKFLLIEL